MIAVALSLPLLSLALLGTLWLWQNNAILIWSVLASVVALVIYGVEYWFVIRGERDAEQNTDESSETENDPPLEENPMWTERDRRAWEAVEDIASKVDPAALNSRDEIIALAARIVETVAGVMHPNEKDPLWKFTVPEALVLIERVSAELNQFVILNIPLGDRLTVGRLRTIYRWRSLINSAGKAYDLWRILRFLNPGTAIAGELRERVSRQLLDGLLTEMTRRLARAYVREVGRAAIDLYSNRLKPDVGFRNMASDSVAIKARAPIRLLLAGQRGSGKSSLVNALSGEVKAVADVIPSKDQNIVIHELTRGDELFGHLIDMPGISDAGGQMAQLIELSLTCDAIVWVVSALRPDRAVDVKAIDELREAFEGQVDVRPPPFLFVVTNIDRLRPFDEWQPPYDLEACADVKSRSIRQVINATATDLGVDTAQIIPVCIGPDAEPYNIDVLWARLIDIAPAAVAAQLTRQFSEAGNAPFDWRRTWEQAVNAGRIVGRTLWKS